MIVLSQNHRRGGWGEQRLVLRSVCFLFSCWLRPCSVSFVVSEVFFKEMEENLTT